MKLKLYCLCVDLLFVTFLANGQGTFVYDQQASTDTNFSELDVPLSDPAMGQSFTPSLSAIGFVQFGVFGGPTGGVLLVNLLTNSITGSILGSTAPVTFTNLVNGVVTFVFSTPIPLSPGTTYYLQPLSESGTNWGARIGMYSYPGGNAFDNGAALNGTGGYGDFDLWFREGIVAVPEPSSVALVLISLSVFASAQWIQRRR